MSNALKRNSARKQPLLFVYKFEYVYMVEHRKLSEMY